MHERALETRKPSCVPRAAKSFFIHVVYSPPGPWDTWQHQISSLRKVEPGVMRHIAAPELPSQEGRARSHGTRGSNGAHLTKEVRSEAEEHVVASELTSARS
jgi:hypothetical protein